MRRRAEDTTVVFSRGTAPARPLSAHDLHLQQRAAAGLLLEAGKRRSALDDRFHETGIHGAADWLADSSFAIG
jgi:hypothetical protein